MRAGIADYTRTLCPAWSAVCGSALIQVRARAGIQPGWAGIAGDKPGAALAVVASLDVDAGPVKRKTCTTDIYLQNDCAHIGLSIHAPVRSTISSSLCAAMD